jgi:hypothetical protein
MSYLETLAEYQKSPLFLLGMGLMLGGLGLYIVISNMMITATTIEQLTYFYNLSTMVLIFPAIGSVLCVYAWYNAKKSLSTD